MTTEFDTRVLMWVTDIREPWMTVFFHVVTLLGSLPAVALITAAAATVAVRSGRRWDAVLGVVTVVTAWLLMRGLKMLAGRDRPPPELSVVEVGYYSLPSGHALMIATAAVVVGATVLRNRWTWPLLAAVVILVGVSRVYLGAHWPTDVIAGWAIGTIWAFACVALSHALRPTEFRVARRHNPR
ncbi:phosphatase PAP2 family protein [Hoyosella subflava]|uniref:Phosphoesterase PA-phosphatase-like protein n=1 Tax=Hoyosella subflava (strain DSM 45089 / JCM 17490 / NBRC 109087 / DQS3-9A1) TaxID=443218 RepID=F6EM90_HOYSD|nr:phosphatase PAP2 family protein [Hoyosella subflava]AEF39296.1 Phosphoesterase PA-phosphatase -like protein [Hoyosella subflava DQS3-9A1]